MSALPTMALPDDLLIERLRTRDPRAVEELMERFFDDIYRFQRHLTRHVQDAEDLAQLTLLRAIRGASGFDGRSGLRTWLHRIAYREFLVWHRGRRIWSSLDPRRSVRDRQLEAVVDREILLAALGKLSEKLRAAFLLVEVQELSYEEAATALEVPVGTVKSRLGEARRILASRLEIEGEGSYVAESI